MEFEDQDPEPHDRRCSWEPFRLYTVGIGLHLYSYRPALRRPSENLRAHERHKHDPHKLLMRLAGPIAEGPN